MKNCKKIIMFIIMCVILISGNVYASSNAKQTQSEKNIQNILKNVKPVRCYNGHIYRTINTKQPTCENTGYVQRKCEVCGYITKNTIPALGHNMEYYTTESVSANQHVKIYNCTRCNYTTESAENHKFNSENKCTKCNFKIIHNHVAIKPATCTTSAICACGTVLENPKGHKYGAIKIQESTCENLGVKERKCNVCGYTQRETINIKDHNMKYSTTESISKDQHIIIYKCNNCDYTTEKLENHELNENNMCTKCNYKETHEHKYIIPGNCKQPAKCICGKESEEKIEHEYETKITRESTCNQVGIKEEKCIKCDDLIITILPALEHDMHGINVKMITDTKHMRINKCSRCDKTEEIIESHITYANAGCICGFKESKVPEHKHFSLTIPTCKKQAKCYICKELYGNLNEHKYGFPKTKLPTCEEKGEITRKCIFCAEIETNELQALGHNMENHKCTRCNYTEKVGHIYLNGQSVNKVDYEDGEDISVPLTNNREGKPKENIDIDTIKATIFEQNNQEIDLSVFSAGSINLPKIINAYVDEYSETGKTPKKLTLRLIEPAYMYIKDENGRSGKNNTNGLTGLLKDIPDDLKPYITIQFVVGEEKDPRKAREATYAASINAYADMRDDTGFAAVEIYAVNQDTVTTTSNEKIECQNLSFSVNDKLNTTNVKLDRLSPHEIAQIVAVEYFEIGTVTPKK